jgi:hypothetical protein
LLVGHVTFAPHYLAAIGPCRVLIKLSFLAQVPLEGLGIRRHFVIEGQQLAESLDVGPIGLGQLSIGTIEVLWAI